MISPVIHRLQPELDRRQRAVIGHLEGPLLVIAGPGAGKTRTIVWRACNLLLLGAVVPAELVMCTFSKRAAHELRQRFTAAAQAAGCVRDLTAVRVATVHGLCRRILSEHGASAGLKPDPALLSEREQLDLLSAHFHRVFGPDKDELRRHGWRTDEFALRQARRYFERIAEEAIDLDLLTDSEDPFHAAIGRCCLRYEALLDQRGALDLSRLQVRADELLQDDSIARKVGAGVRHLMVDEYQDTGCVQERVLLRLAEAHGNPCAVGDDDQSVYRFRGASVRNLLEFPDRFPDATVRRLTVNYRSHSGIVRAYDRWMASAEWSNPGPGGMPFRHHKTIKPHNAAGCHADYPSVIAALGNGPQDEARLLAELLRLLRLRGVIADYSQAALLLHSVKERASGHYLSAFADGGIPYHHAPANARRLQPDFPAGRVCVTTIHQAKGLEWPVVAVGSLDGCGGDDEVGSDLDPYFPRPTFEPPERIPDFDRMRQHYVAFSRAQNLLILTAGRPPAAHFAPIWKGLPRWPNLDHALRDKLLSQRFGAERHSGAPLPSSDLAIPRVKRLILRTGGQQPTRAKPA